MGADIKLREEAQERLAEEVHRAWMGEKTRQGFHYPGICPYGGVELCMLCHPDIVDYSQLSENKKDIDRALVNAILDTLGLSL